MAGIGVILNPHSRSNRKNPGRVKRFGFIVGDKGSCHETQSLADVETLVHEFRDRHIDILGISGGDGTLHTTLTYLVRAYAGSPLPKIAFLRGGTMNNVATTLGIHGTPEQILSQLILQYHRGDPFQTTQLNLLHVNQSYGFVFGMGGAVRFLDAYSRYGNGAQTPWRALLLVMGYVLSSVANGKRSARLQQRFDAQLLMDGKKAPFQNYTTILAGTLESICFNVRPLYLARTLREEFQVVGMSCTPRHLIHYIPAFLMAKPTTSPCFVDQPARHLVIECAHPERYMLDGDFPEPATTRIDISLGPRLDCIAI